MSCSKFPSRELLEDMLVLLRRENECFGKVWECHGRALGQGQTVSHFWTDLRKIDSGTVMPMSTGRPCQSSVQARFRLSFVRFVSWLLV